VQNLAFAAFIVPHFGHAIVAPAGAGAGERAWPQLLQNFALSALSAWQFGQRTWIWPPAASV
jgi:hypothetical protein